MMSQFFAIPGGSFAYIVTPENSRVSQFQDRIKGFIAKNWGADVAKDANLLLQPLTDIHFDQRYLNNTISYTTSRNTYFALSAVAMLILVIACINFINLATARAIRRAKEVGVRKVLGSNRGQLVIQFLTETGLMVVSALVLGLLVTFFFLPLVSRWMEMKMNFSQLMDPSVILWVLTLTVVVILLAGLYPAFVQSAFNPAASLKSKTPSSYKGLTLRKALVVLQFAISQVMIVGTLVVAYQMDYFQNRDLGFNKEAVISFGIPDEEKREVLKQQLLSNPGVKELIRHHQRLRDRTEVYR
jgi:predicted lysophospholipase L1 biosynthesis ABC-type transport system permease subunit